LPPYAHVTSNPPDARPRQPVTFDASKSCDMDKKPCVKYVWDFGDGSPKKTTKVPTVKHPYAKPGSYPVSVEVTDKNGLTGDAFLSQRVSDPGVGDSDPSKGGKGPKSKNHNGRKGREQKENDDPKNTFDSVGGHEKPGMAPEEIGDEFRNITHEAVSNALLDPNKRNKDEAKLLAKTLCKLDPTFPDGLDPDAKRQVPRFRPPKPMGPKRKPLPKAPPKKEAVNRLHHVETEISVNVGKPIMPDI